ncbi:KR domain protein [Leptospira yanagawae serovar Saopaulo str. Sao Paulo = ATCC 700523]|uniref:Glucose 1-dehydrogenase n=2 Tax=Leptospira yanagawae TaxID=293069 RepID=A0ABY2M4C7_9LEPT|nr:glucose 1-dehydrogenase [Leptospira yanagawae]EOQ88608.1 KR domain protein [Leptospira yanagawae serovar Saopaulo str. Sao Paulo = ATCC 700523]TGL20052.1 glucose 1-dehydrogenase [Leptospira yanagawae]
MKENKVAIVTGGTSGLGRSIVLEFANAGYVVGFCGRRKQEGEDTLSLLQKQGGKGLFIKCDVTQSEAVRNFVEAVVGEYGKIDVAVNNAGISGVLKTTAEYPLDIFDSVMDVNLKGTFLSMQFELKQFLKQGNGGAIINVSSALGLRGKEKAGPYSMTKHGIIGLTKSAALEYGSNGIRVIALCPGGIQTDMDDVFYANVPNPEEVKKERMKSYALGRMATPEEVAKTCVWLCGEGAAFITGAVIPVDGGKTAK